MTRPNAEDLDAMLPNQEPTTIESARTDENLYTQVTVLYGEMLEVDQPLSAPDDPVVAELDEVLDDTRTTIENRSLKSFPSSEDASFIAVGIPDSTDEPAARCARLALDLKRHFNTYQLDRGGGVTLGAGIETGSVQSEDGITPSLCYDLTRRSITIARGLASRASPGTVRVTGSTMKAVENQTDGEFIFEENRSIELSPGGTLSTYRLEESTDNPFCGV